jgi:hypothetical protein
MVYVNNNDESVRRALMRLLRTVFMVLVLAASLLSWNLPLSQAGSATPASGVAGHGNTEQGSLPTATAEPEEHGLSKKALEIASLREKLSAEEIASVNASLARSLAQLHVKRRHKA